MPHMSYIKYKNAAIILINLNDTSNQVIDLLLFILINKKNLFVYQKH